MLKEANQSYMRNLLVEPISRKVHNHMTLLQRSLNRNRPCDWATEMWFGISLMHKAYKSREEDSYMHHVSLFASSFSVAIKVFKVIDIEAPFFGIFTLCPITDSLFFLVISGYFGFKS